MLFSLFVVMVYLLVRQAGGPCMVLVAVLKKSGQPSTFNGPVTGQRYFANFARPN